MQRSTGLALQIDGCQQLELDLVVTVSLNSFFYLLILPIGSQDSVIITKPPAVQIEAKNTSNLINVFQSVGQETNNPV